MIARLALAGLAGSAIGLASHPRAAPRWLWNATASAPLGLWRLQPVRTPVVGDWVAVRPPGPLAAALAARGALPRGVLLLKQVAAVAPSQVCRTDDAVVIDGRVRALARATDRRGRPLPQWRACRPLKPGEVFLLNRAPGSLDSRYFGPLDRSAVASRAQPWLIRGGD